MFDIIVLNLHVHAQWYSWFDNNHVCRKFFSLKPGKQC